MITKDNLLTAIMDASVIMMSGGSAISIAATFAGFNPLHAFIGAAGQLIYIVMEYVRATNTHKPLVHKNWLYWLAVIVIGAALGYLGTGYLSKKIGLNEVITGVGIGFFAQALPDIYDIVINGIKNIIKKKLENG